MTNKQADKVIKDYQPHKGFFDLSEKPKTLNKKGYAILLDTQNALARANKYYKEHGIIKLKEHDYRAAKKLKIMLQEEIFKHWGLGILEAEE